MSTAPSQLYPVTEMSLIELGDQGRYVAYRHVDFEKHNITQNREYECEIVSIHPEHGLTGRFLNDIGEEINACADQGGYLSGTSIVVYLEPEVYRTRVQRRYERRLAELATKFAEVTADLIKERDEAMD